MTRILLLISYTLLFSCCFNQQLLGELLENNTKSYAYNMEMELDEKKSDEESLLENIIYSVVPLDFTNSTVQQHVYESPLKAIPDIPPEQ